jgi:cytochrome c-type biogenesis protein
MNAADITVWLAFGAGLLSFVSPCCLPLYPSFLSYITGVSIQEVREGKGLIKRTALIHTLFFMIGFSTVFFALGLSASWLGKLFSANQQFISQIGGILIFVFGLIMIGIFKPQLLMKERRIQLQKKPAGYFGSCVVGITYAAGWTPCIGPILSAVITLGVAAPTKAFIYVAAYTLGFIIPFFVLAFFIGKIKWLQLHSQLFMRVGGGIMVLTGILLYTGQLTQITIVLIRLYGGFT